MAFHTAVHDAFGYLYTYHDIGPGYDYLGTSRMSLENKFAGRFDGVSFWKTALNEISTINMVARKKL